MHKNDEQLEKRHSNSFRRGNRISFLFSLCVRDSGYYAVSELDVVHKNLLATRSRNKKKQIPKVLHFLKSHENRKQTSNFAH